MADVFKAVEEIFKSVEESKNNDEFLKPNPIDKYFQEEDARNALSLNTSSSLQQYALEEARKKALVENAIIEKNEREKNKSSNQKKFMPEVNEPQGYKDLNKPRKKIIPKTRDTNEGLLLVYEITSRFNIEYLDELPAIRAWGEIISKKFTSDLIKEIAQNYKSITLNGGDKLIKSDFCEKYRKRFK